MKKKVLFIIFVMTIIFTACSKGPTETPKDAATQAPTATPLPTAVPVKEVIVPAEPFDAEGRVFAVYGTPIIDGTIDDVWSAAGVVVPTSISSPNVKATGEFRVMWDDNALYSLYIITDPVLNKASTNTYEQDSVEVFLDELNDKAASYQSDDVHYRDNFDNSPSTDAGDSNRFYTATSALKDENGNVIGYIVETSLTWSSAPSNNTVMGFDLQINDADASGVRLGTVNIFDKDGTAWSNPSSMGEIILSGKSQDSVTATSPYLLTAYVKYVEEMNPEGYVNSNLLTEPLAAAKKVLENSASTQEQIDAAIAKLREVVAVLDDGSGFVNVAKLEAVEALPDPFTFFNGDAVKTAPDWSKRSLEISNLFQYYMYGVMPDTSDEVVTYKIDGSNMNITVEKGGKSITYPVVFSLPDKSKVSMPKGGYPVLIAFGWLTQTQYANDHGYATITLDTSLIAADDTSRTGVFYDLYPYGTIWKEQTGALMAWTWGVSKIIDALENGASADLNINASNTILTGVSRWGKAAAVAGAFEKRIKVTAPSCSGSGGMASFRYKSEGKSYDYSSIGNTAPYIMTANEPLSSLQSSGERQWFNDMFLKFKDITYLPFDQDLLASLCAEKDRYLFITGSYLYEDWTNPPGMWLTYLASKKVFDYLGLSDNIAIHIHKEGHMVTDEDVVYLLDFCDYHFYGKKVKSNLKDLTTSYFMEPANYDPYYDQFLK